MNETPNLAASAIDVEPAVHADAVMDHVDQGNMETVAAPAASKSVAALPSVGEQLSKARGQHGLTIAQVAERMRLAPRQIEALEANDWAYLPGPTIIRGFVRNYAKILKLDAEPLMVQLASAHAVQAIHLTEAATYDSIVPDGTLHKQRTKQALFIGQRSRWLKIVTWLLVAVALIVVITGGLYAGNRWLVGRASPPKAVTSASASVSPAASGSHQQSADMVSTIVSAPGLAGVAAASGIASALPTSSMSAAVASVTNVPVLATSSSAIVASTAASSIPSSVIESQATKVMPVDPTQTVALRVVAKQDSWVEIKHADGTPALAQLLKAGAIQIVNVVPPARVHLGNAAGIELDWRQKKIDTLQSAKQNVANFELK